MASYMPSANAAFAIAGLACVGYVLYRLALPRPIPGIPYRKGATDRLLGDLPDLIRHITKDGEVLNWWADATVELNSPIIQLFVRPFQKPFVVLTDYRESQDIMVRRTKEFDRSNVTGDSFVGVMPNHHISMRTNDAFKAQKRLIADLMSPTFLNEVAGPQIWAAATDVVELWNIKAKLAQGHPFEAPGDIHRTALEAIWAATFGSEIGVTKSQIEFLTSLSGVDVPTDTDEPAEIPKAPTPPEFDAMIALTNSMEKSITSPFPLLYHWFVRQTKGYKNAAAHKDQYIRQKLQDAWDRFSKTQESSDRSGVDNMLRREIIAANKEGREPEIDTPTVKDEVFGLLLAGHETTSTTLTWGLKFLTAHQPVQRKLRELLRANLTSAAGTRTNPTPKDIATANIPYLDAVVEEILRCSMTVTAVMRKALVDTEVLGYKIPKGTDVGFLSNGPGYVMPYLPVDEMKRSATSQGTKEKIGNWAAKDVGTFDPERWVKRGEKGNLEFDPKAGPNMPFGGGIRGCFGKKMAYLELRVFLVLIVWNFVLLETPEKLSDWKAMDKITHHPRQCYIRIKPVEW